MLLKCYISPRDIRHTELKVYINTEHIVKIDSGIQTTYLKIYLVNNDCYLIDRIKTKNDEMYLDMRKNIENKDEYIEKFLFNVFGG